MIADTKLPEYYRQFTKEARLDIIKYSNTLNKITKERIEYKKEIDKYKDIYDSMDLDISVFDNDNTEAYSNLYNKVRNKIMTCKTIPNKEILLKLSRYCNLIRREEYYKEAIKISTIKANIEFSHYRNIVSDYYYKVQEIILKGYSYRYSYGIGTLRIDRCKPSKGAKRKIDYVKTKKNKQEIINNNGRLYSEKEKRWYEDRNMTYNVPDYRVYKTDQYFYLIRLIKPSICYNSELVFKHNEYVNNSLKGLGYEYVADNLCHSEEDVLELKADTRYKLIIYLRKYPIKYLNYVR